MTQYEGPDRLDPTDDTAVEVSEESYNGSFTVYLKPGETAEISYDDPNRVTINVPDTDIDQEASR